MNPNNSDLLTKIKQLQDENSLYLSYKSTYEKMKKQNTDYKSRLLSQDREISILEEKVRLFNIVQSKCESELIEEIRLKYEEEYKQKHCSKKDYDRLINELNMKELTISTLEYKLQSAIQSNTSTTLLNNNLKDQITKRSSMDYSEIDNALDKVILLEKDNREKDKIIKELSEITGNNNTNEKNNTVNNSSNSSNSCTSLPFVNISSGDKDINEYKKIIAVLKGEVKSLQKKYNEEKISFENTIKIKEMTIIQLENNTISLQSSLTTIQEELSLITTQNHSYKKRIDELTTINRDQQGKFKSQRDTAISEHKTILSNLNERLTRQEIDLTKSKHLESIYKEQLTEKTKDIEAKLQFISELQSCLNKQIDDNFSLRKQYASAVSDLNNYKSKCEELSKGDHIHSALLEEKVVLLSEIIQKKKRIIMNKKKENMILADMVNNKKTEIQCIEALNIIKSQSIMDNLSKLREKEKDNIKKIELIANDEDYTDDSITGEDKKSCNYDDEDDDDYNDAKDCEGEGDGTIDEEIEENRINDVKKKINYDDVKDLDQAINNHEKNKANELKKYDISDEDIDVNLDDSFDNNN